jgi:hypothetical protein
MTHYRPTFASFLASLPIALWPAAVAAVVVWLLEPGIVLKVFSALMVIFALHNVISAVFVHRTSLYVDPHGILMKGSLGGLTSIEWTDVTSAVLRERENPVTRTDHLLIIDSDRHRLMFNTHILKLADEKELLETVRRHVPLGVHRDTPAV